MSIAHLHLVLVHVPVIGALVAVILFATALLHREIVSTRFALAFTVGLGVVAVAAYFTGQGAEEAVEKLAGVTERSIEQHEEAAELATIVFGVLGCLSLIALVLFRGKRLPGWVAVSGLVGALITSALMAWTANLGGQIRHTEIQNASGWHGDEDT